MNGQFSECPLTAPLTNILFFEEIGKLHSGQQTHIKKKRKDFIQE